MPYNELNDDLPNELLHKQYNFDRPLTCLGDFLLKFSESTTFSVWVKDIVTYKHIMNNQICSNKWGLNQSGLTGMTTREVLERVKDFSTLEEELKTIEANERTALENNKQNVFLQTLLTHGKKISLQKTLITPMLGTNNQAVAIVGMAYEFTKHANLMYLLDLYQRYYLSKKQVVTHFSHYLALDRYFLKALSFAELKTLCAMTQDIKYKSVAQLQNISIKTLSSYLESLKDKLKTNVELFAVVNLLKNRPA